MHHDVIGTGPVGFTAIGLDLTCEQVLGRLSLPADAEVAVEVPAFAVVAADNFSAFLERNRFDPLEFVGLSNRQIAQIFLRGELPHGLREQLSGLPESLEGPLIVRPSSVLEASLERSFGGVYRAKLIPNQGEDLVRRRRQLIDAIKLVWASTYFADAVNSRLGAGQQVDSEQMAVVVQRALGARYGDRFYPSVSVVARSYNHYPAPGNEPDEGVVSVALGLGRIISEGHAWSYCPERPTAPPPFKSMNDLLKNTQKSFWAVDLSGSGARDPIREEEHLIRLGLVDAETDGTLDLLASTYDADSDRLRAGVDGVGARALTIAPLLRSRSIPFTSVVKTLLDSARMVTGSEVEIELAAVLDPTRGVPVRFGVVQLKTMGGRAERDSLSIADLSADGVIVASTSCLGDGTRADLDDIVYMKPDVFDRNRTRTVAAELEAVNRGLLEEGRRAVFLGFGRWGTTDERYGVPVRWAQISSAQVIVEVTMPDVPLNLSHGTHFFHHLLSQRVLYLSLEHDGPYEVDFGWLDETPAVWEGQYVRHVRSSSALWVNVDGGSGRGVIRR
jgi:Pyruvate phosphate dikinase, AMP/ATP-binding domain